MKTSVTIVLGILDIILYPDQPHIILLQKAVEILPGDTPEVLQKRVMEQAEWKLLPKAVAMICNGEIK